MPRVEEGDRVKLRYICRLEDGTIYDFSDRDYLEFIVGEGEIMPELEKAVLGMKPGERKVVQVPAFEVEEFRFVESGAPNSERFAAGTTSGDEEQYDIGPGEEADDGEEASVEGLRLTTFPPQPGEEGAEEDMFFDIELLEIEDSGLHLGDTETA